jgi:uncharacterized YccA/Bax inhibitor family protein
VPLSNLNILLLAPGYALFEGLFIGGISAIFEAMYPGIVIHGRLTFCDFYGFVWDCINIKLLK